MVAIFIQVGVTKRLELKMEFDRTAEFLIRTLVVRGLYLTLKIPCFSWCPEMHIIWYRLKVFQKAREHFVALFERHAFNGPFLRSPQPLFQGKSLCEVFVMNISFHSYYMAKIVRPLWSAAEWALFSCNDQALWNFSRLFWVASKSTERVGENNKKDGQKVVQLYFQ